ncbi:MAG TPA: Xaa-Pro peptidase family protein [Alloacidobacterium sp.]|jgi:Xaa-Pro aminopeptidase|nr:Xaa-Pro peptidase family protein [Alloacidobacterium sp.]
MNHTKRIRVLRGQMQEQGMEAMLITHLPDVRYLCGFTGSNAALAVTAKSAAMFTDGRYTSQAKVETQGARVVIAEKSALREACAWLEKSGATRAYFDPEHTTFFSLEIMRDMLSKGKRRSFFQPLKKPAVSELRMVKDADELLLMEKAALLGCELFHAILPHIQAGVPEQEIAADLEFFARSLGAEGMSFETIVASGKRSAFPHGRASAAKVPARGFVTLDFGVILNGYCSDMTRTVHMGKPGQPEQFAYDAVLEAQEAAVAAVKPGATCGEVDEAARNVLRKAKLDKYFTHSTGHGVGVEIHEPPRVAKEQEQKLQPGMVITIEPGVYIDGKFGIRIEDMIAVTKSGGKILTPSPKALIQL